MSDGTITFYNVQKGFGFITISTGETYFFHISNFSKGASPVLGGQVRFQIGAPVSLGKRPQALQVRYICDDVATLQGALSGLGAL